MTLAGNKEFGPDATGRLARRMWQKAGCPGGCYLNYWLAAACQLSDPSRSFSPVGHDKNAAAVRACDAADATEKSDRVLK